MSKHKKDIEELEKAHGLTRKGCYAGLLKEPPLPRDHKDVVSIMQSKNLMKRPFSTFCVLAFTSCCGMNVLKGLKMWHPNNIEHRDAPAVNDARFSANIYYLHNVLEDNNKIAWYEKDRSFVPSGRKYVITTLSEHMMKEPHSLHHVLAEYFGFNRLEDDFMNWGSGQTSNRVCLMGLGFSGFHQKEL